MVFCAMASEHMAEIDLDVIVISAREGLSLPSSLPQERLQRLPLLFVTCEWNGRLSALRFSGNREITVGFLPSVWTPEILLDSRCARLRADLCYDVCVRKGSMLKGREEGGSSQILVYFGTF